MPVNSPQLSSECKTTLSIIRMAAAFAAASFSNGSTFASESATTTGDTLLREVLRGGAQDGASPRVLQFREDLLRAGPLDVPIPTGQHVNLSQYYDALKEKFTAISFAHDLFPTRMGSIVFDSKGTIIGSGQIPTLQNDSGIVKIDGTGTFRFTGALKSADYTESTVVALDLERLYREAKLVVLVQAESTAEGGKSSGGAPNIFRALDGAKDTVTLVAIPAQDAITLLSRTTPIIVESDGPETRYGRWRSPEHLQVYKAYIAKFNDESRLDEMRRIFSRPGYAESTLGIGVTPLPTVTSVQIPEGIFISSAGAVTFRVTTDGTPRSITLLAPNAIRAAASLLSRGEIQLDDAIKFLRQSL